MDKDNLLKENVSNTFTEISNLYDEDEPRFFKYFGTQLVNNIEILDNANILDIACGKGAVAFSLLEKNNTARITAIDISKGMLEMAKKENKSKNIDFKIMDAENLTFQENSFNFVFCGFGVFFFPNYEKVFQNVFKILLPGGIFSFSTFRLLHDHDILKDVFKKYFNDDEIGKASNETFSDFNQLEKILYKNNFEKYKIINEKKYFYYKDVDHWWKKINSHGMKRKINSLTIEQQKKFKKEVYEILDSIKTPTGLNLFIDVFYSYGIKI